MEIPELRKLFLKAEESPRKRHAWSPKEASYSGCRYMLNALIPNTYIQPHRHMTEGANELWFVLQGMITPIIFSENGELKNAYTISTQDKIPFIEIPEKTFHTLLVRGSPSVILEVSRGPYIPETYKEFASWAPSEGSENSQKYLADLERRALQFPIF